MDAGAEKIFPVSEKNFENTRNSKKYVREGSNVYG